MASTRFDYTQVGSGLGYGDYNKGAWAFDKYVGLAPGTPGYDHGQAAAQYLLSKGINPATATPKQKWTALDWRFRDTQRGNQKENSFGSTALGKAFGIAAPIAGSFFGPAGAAIGGAIGGGATGGVKGALIGGAGGYLGAKYVAPYVKGKLGFGGGTGGAGGAGTLLGGAASTAGGGGVGFLDSLGSIAGDVAGDVIGGLFGGFGSNKAAKQFESAAKDSQLIVKPNPFQGNSLFMNTNAAGQASLNPFGVQQRNQQLQLRNQAYDRTQFDRNSFRDRLLEAANRVNDKREAQAFSSLESKLFNRQGASTGTQRQIADFKSDIEDRRFNRGVQSEVIADDFMRGRLADYGGTYNMLGNLDDRFRNQQTQSLQGAQYLSPFGINNPAVGAAGAFRAQSTQDFFDSLGATVGGAVSAGLSTAGGGSGSASSGTGGGFFSPGSINFGANPFTSSYSGLGVV